MTALLGWLDRLSRSRRSKRTAPSFGPRSGEISLDGFGAIAEACRHLPDGARCGQEVVDLLTREMQSRRVATGTDFGPANPQLGDLRIRREGLPDWWMAGGNLMLSASGASFAEIGMGLYPTAITRQSIVVLEAGVLIEKLVLVDNGSLIVAGEGVAMPKGALMAGSMGTILIGAHTNATFEAAVGAKNGGIVVVGEGGLWAPLTTCMTDDEHAVRDRLTGIRYNAFGGRILVGHNVWLGNRASLMGDCVVGHDSVVAAGALVRNVALPPHCVSAGSPARPVRREIVWTREDLP